MAQHLLGQSTLRRVGKKTGVVSCLWECRPKIGHRVAFSGIWNFVKNINFHQKLSLLSACETAAVIEFEYATLGNMQFMALSIRIYELSFHIEF